MKVKPVVWLTLFFMMISSTPCGAAFPQQNWSYYKELPAAAGGFVAVKLDSEVMSNCQEYFTDLRVTDTEGREAASQIIQPGAQQELYEATLLNSIDYPEYSSTVIDLGPDSRPHNSIILNTRMGKYEDYLREVRLQASDDDQDWGELGRGNIFSFQGEQSNQLSYPATSLRYIRVDIMNKAGEPLLKVDSAQVKFLPADLYQGKLIASPIISQRSDKTSTRIILDLGVPNYMVTGIQIKAREQNFIRRVDCATADKISAPQEERGIASARILSYKWDNVLSVKDTIDINQFCRRYLILSIANGDSPPLQINKIEVYGSTPTLIANLNGSGRLWYGNPKAEHPSYDLYEFANLIEKNKLPEQKPGPQQMNPDYTAPVVPWTEKNKWLLDLMIILVAAGLVYFVINNFKRIRTEEENQK